MQKLKPLLFGLILPGLATLPSCFPGVYKIDIQQGNVVTQDMVDQLRPGMTQSQVQYIMGTPLIVDTFHPNRWDYLYSLKPGGAKREQERITLLFDGNNQLAALSGDFRPGISRDAALLGEDPNHVKDTQSEQPEQLEQKQKPEQENKDTLEQQLQHELEQAQPVPVPDVPPLDF